MRKPIDTGRPILAALLAAASLVAATPAHGAGIGRPTVAGARAYGFGGAFTPIADDPTALYYNPAGLALQPLDSILLGYTMALAPREYTPIRGGVEQEIETAHNTPNHLPVLGYSTRLSSHGVPSRLALGIALMNTNGGGGEWDMPQTPEEKAISDINQIETALIEIIPGIAYEVNDYLSLGFGFRLGIGLFSADVTQRIKDANFSATGLGAGANLGVMLRPVPSLQVGLVYRSSLTASLSGDGEVWVQATDTVATPTTVTHEQRWPQSAALGLAWRATDDLRVALQADWFDWSALDTLVIETDIMTQVEALDFHDSWAGHLGAEYALSSSLAVRGGCTYETGAIPERTMSKQYLSGPMFGVAGGAGYQLSRRWRLDSAVEYLFGSIVEVEDNLAEYQAAGWAARANLGPGKYDSALFTFELNLQFQY